MIPIDEKHMIRLAADGDMAAFEQLVTTHQPAIYRLALRMTGNPEDAADMTQEAFIKAYNSLSSVRGDSRFSVWLYRITTNVCLDFLRHKSRRPQVSLSTSDDDEERQLDIPDPKSMPEELLMKKLGMEAVHRGLERLPPKHRQILVMRELGGLSYSEIAAQLSLEEGTVKSRIFRARKNLCAFLLGDGNIPDSIASNDREEADCDGA